MASVSVPWGEGEWRFDLPPEWEIEQVVEPSLRAAPEDWPTRLARTLSQPESGPSLGKLLAARPGGRIVLVVEDITRSSPLAGILDVVLREVRHAGVDDSQIEVFFATGMHPPMTEAQAREKLGPHADALQWRSNPWRDGEKYVHVGRAGRWPIAVDRGVAEADLRIVISSVSPHLQAGFGGGHKMFLPGAASLETIRSLHRQGVGRSFRQLVGLGPERNPMRALIDAGGELVDRHAGRTFAVQYLLDGADRPAFMAAGDMLSTHRMLAKQCAVACGEIIHQPADVVITNAYPRDFDLWQSFKCIPNTLWATRPNGVIICLARCEQGLHGMAPPKWPVSPRMVRRLIRLLGPEPLSSLIRRLAPGLSADAAFFIRLATQTVYRNRVMMVSPRLCEEADRFPGLELYPDVETALAAARKHLGEGRQRACVFPAGGVTYPILPSGRKGERTGRGG